MHDDRIRAEEMTPEQHAEIEGMMLEWDAELGRVGVDMDAARPRLREIAPQSEREIGDAETEVIFTLDVSGIIDTLRSLPDGAGTERFIAAYNSRSPSPEPPAG
jgi:hypothetical protein